MNLDEYAARLGRLVANFHSLEFLIRFYLYERADPPHHPFPAGQTLDTIRVGEYVNLNAMTDYRDLGALINRYNKLIKIADLALRVDPSIVAVRDAIAHGRVSSPENPTRLSLVKFDKLKRGATTTRVTYAQELSAAWLRSETSRIRKEQEKVLKALKGVQPPVL